MHRRLDLVDGTPVYDLKPYIPWDSIPAAVGPAAAAEEEKSAAPSGSSSSSSASNGSSQTVGYRVPSWVTAEDELASVVWTEKAEGVVRQVVLDKHLAPLYSGEKDLPQVMAAIGEVVAQDPRAIHDGRGRATEGSYGMTFSALRVYFEIRQGKATVRVPPCLLSLALVLSCLVY